MPPNFHIETPTVECGNAFYYDAIPFVENNSTQAFKYVAINFTEAEIRKQNSTTRTLKSHHQLKRKHI